MLDNHKPALDDDLLMHYGVKGMRWGHHKAPESSSGSTGSTRRRRFGGPDVSGVTRSQAREHLRKTQRQLTRELEDWSEDTDRKTRDAEIKSARKERRSAERTYKDIRRDIKAQRKAGTLGRHAAKIALIDADRVRLTTAFKSEQSTTGERVFSGAMAVLGSTHTQTLLSGATSGVAAANRRVG